MDDDIKPTQEDFDNTIYDLESEIGIPKGFCFNLKDEDGWSFIIKLQALIDAAVTHLLTHSINKPELEGVITRLELGNSTNGKLAFIKKLDLLNESERRLVKTICEIRNDFVHNISNTGKTLSDYLAQNEKERIIKSVIAYLDNEDVKKKDVIDNSVYYFLRSGIKLLRIIYLQKYSAEMENKITQRQIQITNEVAGFPPSRE